MVTVQGPAKKQTARAKLSGIDVTRVRVESGCSEKTIRKWANGSVQITTATHMRIMRAMQKLGIPKEAT